MEIQDSTASTTLGWAPQRRIIDASLAKEVSTNYMLQFIPDNSNFAYLFLQLSRSVQVILATSSLQREFTIVAC